ncbi:MAG: 2-C-methyl-D-erythritol 2,4-cyclodiphosphate synthase [Blastocatellia bacterium]|nr:2-C-methyl-D-erythritol 2,4-cyclodiphosphate synthase [Blastocatellia bacterium]MCS7157364.1 2-C-methyl-D-erythritol 2,4-cyclodiphosphate synthase [Blastocatellia bacterium]MCX7753230.1 2-C-methyl-D-erythritol 2,4-cyclodiphosphate synthase [Blastocatellia bacterium]MDW8168269.1 2-C-methyl-D-erythritol 2,4-cyclodiphosphate synthase [Acidobacteriota bacterium]MDW8255438.1 2-C-methyl-D-erythritol 2,4-cyclodiphosphate synthase [Acidobacteriota bacterium]
MSERIGFGYDLHRLVEGRRLVLGGIEIPFPKGLAGHSDADVVLHSLCDALLGAAGLGDLGRHFPDTDPRYAGISSAKLLEAVLAELAQREFEIENVDVTILAEVPRLSPVLESMRNRVAELLQIPPDRVNIKAKTNEGVDAIGRGEAIAAYAVCLLRRSGA